MALEIRKPCAACKLTVSSVPELWWVRSSCAIFSSIQQTSPCWYPVFIIQGETDPGLNTSAEQCRVTAKCSLCFVPALRAPFDSVQTIERNVYAVSDSCFFCDGWVWEQSLLPGRDVEGKEKQSVGMPQVWQIETHQKFLCYLGLILQILAINFAQGFRTWPLSSQLCDEMSLSYELLRILTVVTAF